MGGRPFRHGVHREHTMPDIFSKCNNYFTIDMIFYVCDEMLMIELHPVREWRMRSGYTTLARLSLDTGVSQSTLSRMERGRGFLNYANAQRVSQATGVHMDRLCSPR